MYHVPAQLAAGTMAGEEVDPNKVKRIVRAILLSSKHGCTPKQLLSDYERNIGTRLPFRELGFASLSEFVASMPDAVRVSQNGGTVVLYGIPDESTEQLSRMISRQKDSKRPVIPSSEAWDNPTPSAPKAPVTFVAQLRMLMLAYPSGLEVNSFAEAFVRRFNFHLSFHSWGFTSLEQLLQSLPNVVSYTWDSYRKSYVIKQVPKVPEGRQTSASTRKPQGPRGPQRRNDYYNPIVPPLPRVNAKPRESLHSLDLSPGKGFISELKSPPPKRHPSPSRGRQTVSRQVVAGVKELLKANPAGIWASRFQLEYKEQYDQDLPVASMGFTSVVSFLSSLHVCELERPSGMGDWLVFAKGEREHKLASMDRRPSTEPSVSEQLITSIQAVLKSYPNGLLLSKLPTAFKEVLHQDLPVEELGFKSVGHLLQHVPQVTVSEATESGLLMIYLREEEEEQEEVEKEKEEEEGEKQDVKEKQPRPSSYAYQPPPKNVKNCSVYVTWVKTPSCICVQLIGETTTKSLEYLLEDITQFYSSTAGDRYKVEDPQVGQPCCTVFANDGYWYRAEVIGLPAPDIAEVRYVDYGNTGKVPQASLRRPKPHYLALPAQAVNCRLANLKPAGSTWSKRATQLLFQMTKEKPLVAIITSVTDNCMSVCLCDTTTERDIHINDSLVSQGLALFIPDSEVDRKGYDTYKLEGEPVGSTGDKVPEVRAPSSASNLQIVTGTDSSAQQQIAASQLQMQSYIQQLLLLQQQQNALLLGQPPPAMPAGIPPLLHGVPPPPSILPGAPPRGLTGQEEAAAKPVDQHAITEGTGSSSVGMEAPVITQQPSLIPAQSCEGPTHETTLPTTGMSGTSASTVVPGVQPTREDEVPSSSMKEDRLSDVGAQRQTDTGDLLLVKRVELTRSHCLHVLRYNGRGYVTSSEVSLWFWDSDLLQSMLRQVQKPVWGLLLEQWKVPSLFTAVRRTKLCHLLRRRGDMTVYSLDDLPTIVNTFPVTPDLRAAVGREVEQWQREGLQYFRKDDDVRRARAAKEQQLETMQRVLKYLQNKRKEVLVAMCQQSDTDSSSSLEKLIKTEESIKDAKKKIVELERDLGSTVNPASEQKVPLSSAQLEKTTPGSIIEPPSTTKTSDLPWLSVSTSSTSGSSPTADEGLPTMDMSRVSSQPGNVCDPKGPPPSREGVPLDHTDYYPSTAVADSVTDCQPTSPAGTLPPTALSITPPPTLQTGDDLAMPSTAVSLPLNDSQRPHSSADKTPSEAPPMKEGPRADLVEALATNLTSANISSPPSFPDITAALLGLGRGEPTNQNRPQERIGLGRGRLRRASFTHPIPAEAAPGQPSLPPRPTYGASPRSPLLPTPSVPTRPWQPPSNSGATPTPMPAFIPYGAQHEEHFPPLKASVGRGSDRRYNIGLGRGCPTPVFTGSPASRPVGRASPALRPTAAIFRPVRVQAGPAPISVGVQTGSAPIPVRVQAGPTPLPVRVQAGPVPIPMRVQAGPALLPVGVQIGPTPIPVRVQAGPAPIPVRVQAGPAPIPVGVQTGPTHRPVGGGDSGKKPVIESGAWQYVSRARKRGGATWVEFPPIGSAAGLDII